MQYLYVPCEKSGKGNTKAMKIFQFFCPYLSIILRESQHIDLNELILSKNENDISKKLKVLRTENPPRLSVILGFNWESDSKDEVIQCSTNTQNENETSST